MDDKGAATEQHCRNSNNRPGDVYHPDFVLGKSAYFDVSVRCSLQLQFLCKAAVQAGVAGEAGEIEKDSKHEEDVLSAGGQFNPWLLSRGPVDSQQFAYPPNYHFERLLSQRHSSGIGCEKSPPAVVNSPLGLQCPNAPR